MAILLIAEHDNATLLDQTAKALSAASKIGGDVDILVAGKGTQGAADAVAKLAGVRKVLLAEPEELAECLAEPLAALIVKLAPAMIRSSRRRRPWQRTSCRAWRRFST